MPNPTTTFLVASRNDIDLWSTPDGWAVYRDGDLVVADTTEAHARRVFAACVAVAR